MSLSNAHDKSVQNKIFRYSFLCFVEASKHLAENLSILDKFLLLIKNEIKVKRFLDILLSSIRL